MNRSRLLMIGGLALAVGLLVSYTVYNKLRTFTGANNERMVQVLVAANDLLVGARLTDHDVRPASFPISSVPPGAFTRPSQVRDRGVILPISRGDFILTNKLAADNAGSGLPSMIPQGMRAVSVRVNDVVSVAGFVQPGTRVDVLATGNTASGNDRQTTTVLENVAVIAVGKNMDRSSPEAQIAPVITLLVSPDDAQKLALASQEGRIQLALRNPLDTKMGGIPATRASSLYPNGAPPPSESKPREHKTVAKAAPPLPAAPYQVEVIRGNKREDVKFPEEGKL